MQAKIRTHPLVWVRDEAGRRLLCPMDKLRSLNRVRIEERVHCVDDDSRLEHPQTVPGEIRLRFGESMSPN